MEEIWKDVPEYEGLYQVSSFGRVKSLERIAFCPRSIVVRKLKEKFLKPSTSRKGYLIVRLTLSWIERDVQVHQLVAIAFLGHVRNGNTMVVDHIDGNPKNNKLFNLRIVTSRENNSTCFRKNKESYSSKYAGVSWDKFRSKWAADITYNHIRTHLGRFLTEQDASDAYQNALKKYV